MNEQEENRLHTDAAQTTVAALKDAISREKVSFFVMIRSRIITGLFVVIPIFISIWIAWFVYSKMTEWAVEIVSKLEFPRRYLSDFWVEQLSRIVSLVCILALLIIVGQLAKMAFGKKVIHLTQKLLLKVPLINFIYSTCKQIGDALWSSKGGGMFRQVVMFEYPRKGCYAIGFLTNENREEFEVTEKLADDMLSIFMPTTPNPTSGFLMFIPRSECIFLKMTVSEAMRLIVSCGAVTSNTSMATTQTGIDMRELLKK